MSRFFLPVIVFFLILANFAKANDAIDYIIEDITIAVEGKSPSDASQVALINARRQAFLELMSRLQLNNINNEEISDEEIANMVISQQITNEKIAGNRYLAIFTINFDPNFVQHILAQELPTPQNVTQNQNYLIFPIKIINHQAFLWEQENNWSEAIRNILNTPKNKQLSQQFIVPEADIENISTINRNNVTTASHSLLSPLLAKYNANSTYNLLFSHDAKSNKIIIDIFHINKLQRKHHRLKFINIDKMNKDNLINKIANKTLLYLASSSQKNQNNSDSSTAKIRVAIDDLEEWLEIEYNLRNSGIVDKISLQSLSKDSAIISVKFIPSKSQIVKSFARLGFDLTEESPNYYILRN